MPVYLGIFQEILNLILRPVFEFIGSLLNAILTPAIKAMMPMFEAVFRPLIHWSIKLITTALSGVLYYTFRTLLQILNTIEYAFDYILGLTPVTIEVTNSAGKVIDRNQMQLINLMFEDTVIRRAVMGVTLMGIALAGAFAVFAMIRSIADLEQKRPVGDVLKSILRSALTLALVPMLVALMLNMSALVLKGVRYALPSPGTSLSTTVFVVSGLNAANVAKYNTNPSFSDPLRTDYVGGVKKWNDYETVKQDFDLSSMDYLVGGGAAIMLIVVLAMSLFNGIHRIFEMLMLYLVAPLFAGAIPYDDGKMFKKWMGLFIGRAFMGVGTLASMRIYLIVLPILMGNTIDYTGGGWISAEMNYVLKLLIAIGGAMAVYKMGASLTTLLDAGAGAKEGQSLDMGGNMVQGKASAAMGFGFGAAFGLFSSKAPKEGGNAATFVKQGLATAILAQRGIQGGSAFRGSAFGGGASAFGGSAAFMGPDTSDRATMFGGQGSAFSGGNNFGANASNLYTIPGAETNAKPGGKNA